MFRRGMLLSSWLLMLLLLCFGAVNIMSASTAFSSERANDAADTAAVRPHIILIVADDLGWNDVGYHGSEVNTPNIDALAKNGVKLENYYVQPMCTPSRAALLSGRYPIHTGLQHEVIYAGQRSGLPLNMKTIANELKDRGYDTHAVGKWHLGFFEEDYLPVQRGFDTWKGYLTGMQGYYTHSNCQKLGCGYDFRNNNSMDFEDNGTYSTFVFNERAKTIITEHDVEKPLFLYMPYQAVHFPLQVPDSYLSQYEYISSDNRRLFAGMATCMDESIGNITRYLKDKEMWNNTIMIFTTDNGADSSLGGNNWPLRGKKWTLWEGGIRGAAFVHSPLLNISRGTTHRSLMHISDWYPTIIAGMLEESLNVSLDGFNMWDSIRFGEQGPRTEILHNIDPLMPHPGDALYNGTFPTNTTAAIRVGDWKLITGYPGVSDWFPPFTYERRKHGEWFMEFLRKREYEVVIAPEPRIKQALLRYDTSFHTSVDSALNGSIERYDPNKWNSEDGLEIMRTSTGEKKNVWLFNITADPEEILDLSEVYPEVVMELLSRLAYYNSTAVPPNFPSLDPEATPSKHNGTWTPWVFPATEDSLPATEDSLLSQVIGDFTQVLQNARSLIIDTLFW